MALHISKHLQDLKMFKRKTGNRFK